MKAVLKIVGQLRDTHERGQRQGLRRGEGNGKPPLPAAGLGSANPEKSYLSPFSTGRFFSSPGTSPAPAGTVTDEPSKASPMAS